MIGDVLWATQGFAIESADTAIEVDVDAVATTIRSLTPVFHSATLVVEPRLLNNRGSKTL